MTTPPAIEFALLAAAGFVTSVVNVLAGGGSFLTLPLLIFLGLPPTEANATNRLGVLAQNVGGAWGFHRHRVLDWRFALRASVPALAGAAVGTWLALHVGNAEFRRILATLMLAVALLTIFGVGERVAARLGGVPRRRLVLALGFLAAGVYAGFVQAGVGFVVLALTTLAGLDLVRGNAVKVVVILMTTALSLLMFVAGGTVHWLPGAALASGSFLGSLVGVRLTVRRGHRFVRGVVTATILVFALLLWRG